MSKYGVIIADPPWTYERSKVQGAAGKEYNTMTLEDICALPIGELAADNSVLFLWATWPLLREAMQVVESWGFTYITGIPWVKIVGLPSVNLGGELEIKPQYGVGYWVRGCSEPILICRRGKVSPPEGDFVGLLSENMRHSRKPDNLHHIAEKLPGPYLEMFARRKRPGWDVFGNEVAGSIRFPSNTASRPTALSGLNNEGRARPAQRLMLGR